MPNLKKLLPTHITLGGTTYTIRPRKADWMEDTQCAGRCVWPDMVVDICYEQAPSEVLNTLIHECLHLCYREWNIKPKCAEERTVTALGYAMTALVAQNPDYNQAVDALSELSRGNCNAT